MSIDPRLMTQLLRLQFQSGDPLSPRSSKENSGDDFSALLESLLTKGETASALTNAASSSGNSPLGLPLSAYTINGALHSLQQRQYTASPSTSYDTIVEEASERHGVEPELIKAVIQSESSYNRYAVSSAGAKGLMQLMDETGRSMGINDPFDPAQNIEGGTRYLSGLLRKYSGQEAVALAAYNAGPGRIDRLGIRTDAELSEKLHLLPAETQKYVSKVLESKQQLVL